MRRSSYAYMATMLLIAACAPAPASQPSSPAVPAGSWEGTLADPSGSFEVHLVAQGCSTVGETCGEIEYSDPRQPRFVLCAPLLAYGGYEDDRFVFQEVPGYRPEECLLSTLKMRAVDTTTLDVEQYVDEGPACCRGTLRRVGSGPPAPTPLPSAPPLAGLSGPLSATDLGGATTQYADDGAGAMWFPIGGSVLALDPRNGQIMLSIEAGTGDNPDDPHSVVVDDSSVIVARAADRSVARFDATSGELLQVIRLDLEPYALALDGDDLWVSSFEHDAVARIDLSSGDVVARTSVSKPTGLAVGAGAVWVVQHRLDALVRIDVATSLVVATISLGAPGSHPVCSMCAENVVFAHGSAWTANNWGRSVTRVDPATNEAAVIPLPYQVWAVTAGPDAVWASQFEETDDFRLNVDVAGVARIDPASGEVDQLSLPAAMSVTWGNDSLWVVVAGRRSDLVYRYAPEE